MCILCHFSLSVPVAVSSAQKLLSLPGSRGPLWPITSCLVSEGAGKEGEEQDLIVEAMKSLTSEWCMFCGPFNVT